MVAPAKMFRPPLREAGGSVRRRTWTNPRKWTIIGTRGRFCYKVQFYAHSSTGFGGAFLRICEGRAGVEKGGQKGKWGKMAPGGPICFASQVEARSSMGLGGPFLRIRECPQQCGRENGRDWACMVVPAMRFGYTSKAARALVGRFYASAGAQIRTVMWPWMR